METWMLVAAGGGILSLVALGGIGWAFKRLPSPKKWLAIGGFAVLGLVGGVLAANATAIAGPDLSDVPVDDDFDAPLDDDF